jgi:hypothetical protein
MQVRPVGCHQIGSRILSLSLSLSLSQEAEIRRIMVQSQLQQIVHETLS